MGKQGDGQPSRQGLPLAVQQWAEHPLGNKKCRRHCHRLLHRDAGRRRPAGSRPLHPQQAPPPHDGHSHPRTICTDAVAVFYEQVTVKKNLNKISQY